MIDSFPGGRDGKVVVGCYGGGGREGREGRRAPVYMLEHWWE